MIYKSLKINFSFVGFTVFFTFVKDSRHDMFLELPKPPFGLLRSRQNVICTMLCVLRLFL